MIDNIKTLYAQVNEKTKFIKYAATLLGKSPLSVRTHWFVVAHQNCPFFGSL